MSPPPVPPKVGPLTRDDLLEIWKSVVDPSYSDPFILKGDGHGLEIIGQAHAQHARVSEAIDTSTQAMFILPGSGQSNEPASGARKATVTLTLARTKRLELPMTIGAGTVFIGEETTDWGDTEPRVVRTGRRYTLLQDFTFGPGEAGPFNLPAVAELPGYGFNNPLPGTIKYVSQPGNAHNNTGATLFTDIVVAGATDDLLLGATDPDVPVLEHIGQYLMFESGLNTGKIRRVIAYQSPDPVGPPPSGGTAVIQPVAVLRTSAIVGTFIDNEPLVTSSPSTFGIFQRAAQPGPGVFKVVVVRTFGTFVPAMTVTGLTSGATFTIGVVDQSPDLVPEPGGTAGWRMLDWVIDWGLTSTNVAKPGGGKLAVLDGLGAERAIYRSSDEDDEHYRARVALVADTTSPLAVLRAANRVLAPFGLSACLREVGTAKMPGFYFDNDFWDYDFVIRPQDRWKILLDYVEFRGFFTIGVPPGTSAKTRADVWAAVNEAKPAGVAFDLVIEEFSCS